jgi:hypothetical protein
MASNYQGFTVNYTDDNGITQHVAASVSVKIRAHGAGSDAAESPLSTDVNGQIAAGSLAAVAAGTKVHFRVENYGGRAFSIAQITT